MRQDRERRTSGFQMVNNFNSKFEVASDQTCGDRSGQHGVCGYCGGSHIGILTGGIVRAPRSDRECEMICPALPRAIHQDDIVHGRIDVTAVRRRQEAELKRLIAASRKPRQLAPKCDHERPVRTHTFSDGKVLKLYRCGCSNGAEILNKRKTHGK